MFALRLIGDAWYCSFTGTGPISANSLNDARHFDTRAEVESEVLLFTSRHPYYIGRVAVKRIRAVEVQKRSARVLEWKERTRHGKKVRVPARTVMDCKTVTHYVTK